MLRPVDHQGWNSQHPYLSQAIQQLHPQIVVEIGVWKGCSAITLAQALKYSNINGVVIAIDTWLGSVEHWINDPRDLGHTGGYPTLFQVFRANVVDQGLQDYIVPLPLDSVNGFEVLKAHDIKPDIVHIDAGHDYRSVKKDIESWWPFLKPGGVMIGDDYDSSGENWVGVKEAFDEYFRNNAHECFEHVGGKCYIGKSKG
jgi:predicted O-methyltransferase YrrM